MPDTELGQHPVAETDAPPCPVASRWTPRYLRLWRLLLIVAAGVFLLCLLVNPVHRNDWGGVALLTLLAVLVSLLPVRLPGHEEGNAFTSPVMPIVFATAGLYGAAAAVLVDALSMLTEAVITVPRGSLNRLRKTAQLVSIAIVSTGFSTLVYALLHRFLFPHGGLERHQTPQFLSWALLSICGFTAYVLQALLGSVLISRFYGQRWDILWHNNVRWALPSGLLMSPVAFIMGILYSKNPLLGIGFIILPIHAARMAVVYHERTLAAYKQGVELLGRVMQEAHPYTHGHLHRVSRWAIKIAQDMQLPAESMQFIGDAAILHDIGKVAVDDRVLNKVGKLSEDDWEMIKKHPVTGAELVAQMRYMGRVAHWIRHHHERPDGTGYPDRLASEDIPVESSIISAVDAFDAMVGGPAKEDQRPYRTPLSKEAAIAELRRHAGTQFSAEVVDTFIAILAREEEEEAAAPDDEAPAPREEDALWAPPTRTLPKMAAPALRLVAGGKG